MTLTEAQIAEIEARASCWPMRGTATAAAKDRERLIASHRLLMAVALSALKDERDGFTLSDDLLRALRAAGIGGEDA